MLPQDIALLHTIFFYAAFMLFAVFAIADTDKKYFFKAFQPFGIVSFPDLPDGCLGGLIPFQFHHHKRIGCYINFMLHKNVDIFLYFQSQDLLFVCSAIFCSHAYCLTITLYAEKLLSEDIRCRFQYKITHLFFPFQKQKLYPLKLYLYYLHLSSH